MMEIWQYQTRAHALEFPRALVAAIPRNRTSKSLSTRGGGLLSPTKWGSISADQMESVAPHFEVIDGISIGAGPSAWAGPSVHKSQRGLRTISVYLAPIATCKSEWTTWLQELLGISNKSNNCYPGIINAANRDGVDWNRRDRSSFLQRLVWS